MLNISSHRSKIFLVKTPPAKQAWCFLWDKVRGELGLSTQWDSNQCFERWYTVMFASQFIVPAQPHCCVSLVCTNIQHPGAGLQPPAFLSGLFLGHVALQVMQPCYPSLLPPSPGSWSAKPSWGRNSVAWKWLGKNRNRPIKCRSNFKEIMLPVFRVGA